MKPFLEEAKAEDLAKLPDLNGMGSFTVSSLSRL